MAGNSDFSATQGSQQGRLSDTVLTNQTISPAEGKGQISVGQNAQTTNGDVEVFPLISFLLIESPSPVAMG